MIGSSIYGVAVIDGSLCSRVYGMRYNPLVCIYPSASPRDNRKLVGYML